MTAEHAPPRAIAKILYGNDELLISLGWAGDATEFRTFRRTGADAGRFEQAVRDRAKALGLEITSYDGDWGLDAAQVVWTVQTGTPELWLAKDKLLGYIDGLSEALSDTYGTPQSPTNLLGRRRIRPWPLS